MKLPTLTVLKITDNPDDTATIELGYEQDFEKLVAERFNVVKPTTEQMSKFILEMLENAIEKKNDWSIAQKNEKEAEDKQN